MPYSLGYTDRWVRAMGGLITGDTDCSVPFPYLPQDTPTRIAYDWTGATFTKLFSALKVGADLMYPDLSNQLLWELLKGVHCPPPVDPDQGCVEYLPSAPFITYGPDNPFIEDDFKPGWLDDAWWRWGAMDTILPDFIDQWLDNAITAITGYETTDVLCHILSLPINSVEAWLNAGNIFPTIQIKFTGTGSVRLNLLSFPVGGRAVVELDEPPNALDILTGGLLDPGAIMVELDRDILSFPPEEYPVVSVPIEVTTPGTHTIYIQFLPVINDTLIPIGFGGGLRSVEMCGFSEGNVPMLDNIIFEDCTLKTVVGGDKTPVAGWENWLDCVPTGGTVDCADIEACLPTSTTINNLYVELSVFEDNSITITNQNRIINYYQAGNNIYNYNPKVPKVMAYLSDQDSVNRMCLALEVWLGAWKAKFLNYAAVSQGAAVGAATVSGFLAGVTGASGLPFIAIPFGLASGWFANQIGVLQDYIDAYNNATAYNEVLCELKKEFSLRGTSYTSYQNALANMPARTSTGDADLISNHLITMLSTPESYIYLMDLLAMTQDHTPSGDDCTCVETPVACGSYGGTLIIPDNNGYTLPDPHVLWSSDVTFSTAGSIANSAITKYDSWFEVTLDDPKCVRYLFFSARHEGTGAGLASLMCKVYVDGVFIKNHSFYWGTINTNHTGGQIDLTPTNSGTIRASSIRIVIDPASGSSYGYTTKVWKLRVGANA